MNKDTTLSIRISTDDLNTTRAKAKQARLSQSEYVIRCCLGRQVVVIEDLKEFSKELRAIGNNLNRLTVLSNTGKISTVNLTGTADALGEIGSRLKALQERRQWA